MGKKLYLPAGKDVARDTAVTMILALATSGVLSCVDMAAGGILSLLF